MLVAVFAIAVLLCLVRLIPYQVSVLVIGAIPAPTLTAISIRRRRLRNPTVLASLLLAWFAFYVVSIGPVAGLGMWLGLGSNRPFHTCFDCFYTPLVFLYHRTSLAWLIEWYADFWQHLGDRLR